MRLLKKVMVSILFTKTLLGIIIPIICNTQKKTYCRLFMIISTIFKKNCQTHPSPETLTPLYPLSRPGDVLKAAGSFTFAGVPLLGSTLPLTPSCLKARRARRGKLRQLKPLELAFLVQCSVYTIHSISI